jgi:hypothetical protein
MFRALLAYPQEVQNSGSWYIACVLCQLTAPGLTRNTPGVACVAPLEDEQVMLETCRGFDS